MRETAQTGAAGISDVTTGGADLTSDNDLTAGPSGGGQTQNSFSVPNPKFAKGER
jgi:hypothetical protein